MNEFRLVGNRMDAFDHLGSFLGGDRIASRWFKGLFLMIPLKVVPSIGGCQDLFGA